MMYFTGEGVEIIGKKLSSLGLFLRFLREVVEVFFYDQNIKRPKVFGRGERECVCVFFSLPDGRKIKHIFLWTCQKKGIRSQSNPYNNCAHDIALERQLLEVMRNGQGPCKGPRALRDIASGLYKRTYIRREKTFL